jgi:anthraniloyl-CoA monooxygenase
MRIVCVGGGPAGLYFAILSKLRESAADVLVLERNRPGAAGGWGIVFWEDLLLSLAATDAVTADRLRRVAIRWGTQQVHLDGRGAAQLGGYGYAVGRARAIAILTERARELGVRVDYETHVNPADLPDADLVVAADGANSGIREHRRSAFGTRTTSGGNHYMWLGSSHLLDHFTFAFNRTPAGWVWFHGHRFDNTTSNVVVECPPETWLGLGFDVLDPREAVAALSDIFDQHLDGHPLSSGHDNQAPARWQRFKQVSNARWSHDNVVLLGDAAHSTHYSIGSGTRLAIEDAIALDHALGQTGSVPDALAAYHRARSGPVGERQRAAQLSQSWFETVPARLDKVVCPIQFAYELRTRRDPDDARSRLGWLVHRATQRPAGLRARQAIGETKLAVHRRRAAFARP